MSRHRRIFAHLLCLTLALLPLRSAAESLVVYCGRGEALVDPILKGFEASTGVELDVRYNQTPALATQLLNEGVQSPADVIFLQESGYLGGLASAGLMARLPDAVTAQVDPRFRDPEGRWVGTSGRARVLVYNTRSVREEELPERLAELSDPRWKGRVGWAPGNASFQAHVSALRHLWGESETRAWLQAMQSLDPVVYPKNSPQVKAAAAGEISIGWVNHYYLYRLWKPGFTAANYSFPIRGDAGNILMVAGAGVREGSPKQALASRLIGYLVGERAQRAFAEEGFEYPTRPGVPTHPRVPPLDSLGLARIDPAYLTDLAPTLELLRELGLQ